MQPTTFWFISKLMLNGSFSIHNNTIFDVKDAAESAFEQFFAGEGIAAFSLHEAQLGQDGFGKSEIIRSREVTYGM